MTVPRGMPISGEHALWNAHLVDGRRRADRADSAAIIAFVRALEPAVRAVGLAIHEAVAQIERFAAGWTRALAKTPEGRALLAASRPRTERWETERP